MKLSWGKKLTGWIAVQAILVPSLVTMPLSTAYADSSTTYDYNSLCGSSSTSSSSTTSGTTQSDQTNSYCAQAAQARTTESFQSKKEIIMLTAGATLTALSVLPVGQGACKAVAYASDATGLGLDVAQAIQEKQLSSAMYTGLSSVGSIAIQAGVKNVMGSASTAVANHTFMNQKQGECLVSAGLAFAQAAVSMLAVKAAKTAEQSALSSAASLDAATTTSGYSAGTANSTTGSSGTSTSATGSGTATKDCSMSTGDAYAACIGSSGNPTSAAITSAPTLAATDGALGGSSVGDLAKGYTGDGSSGSAAGYVGSALGLTPSGTAALKDALDTAAGLADSAYTPGGYSSLGNGKASGAASDMDFSKMMAGLMKQMNPDASKKGEDPSATVFRQLDLLSPDKIMNNKDISLFARVGYRYQKKTSDLDQLNYSSTNNQSLNRAASSNSSVNAQLPTSSKK